MGDWPPFPQGVPLPDEHPPLFGNLDSLTLWLACASGRAHPDESVHTRMQTDRGPVRAAAPVRAHPQGSVVRRPRGAALAWVAALAVVFALAAAPIAAAAEEAPLPEPVQPMPVLILGECTATLSLVDMVPGRAYSITVTDAAGNASFSLADWIADARVLDSFATVPSGEHVLVVTDVADPQFQAVRPVTVAACEAESSTTAGSVVVDALPAAGSPTILVQPATCDLLGATDVGVVVSGLGTGTYTTGVTAGGAPVPGVANRRVTQSSNSTVFPDLPNGGTYTIWVRSPAGSVVATAPVTLPICDLPTLPDAYQGEAGGVDERTLASTGAPLPFIALAGIAALQAGALVGGVAILRRRGSATGAGRHAL